MQHADPALGESASSPSRPGLAGTTTVECEARLLARCSRLVASERASRAHMSRTSVRGEDTSETRVLRTAAGRLRVQGVVAARVADVGTRCWRLRPSVRSYYGLSEEERRWEAA